MYIYIYTSLTFSLSTLKLPLHVLQFVFLADSVAEPVSDDNFTTMITKARAGDAAPLSQKATRPHDTGCFCADVPSNYAKLQNIPELKW